MNPKKPKKPVIPLALPGNSLITRIAIVGGGLVVLIILAVIVSSVLTSGSKEKTASLLTIAQDQTELIRLSTAGATLTTSIPGQNLAQNVQATVTSDNAKLLSYLRANGTKLSPAQLGLKKSKTADATLLTAQQNNAYDTTFIGLMQADLATYKAALQKAYQADPGPKGKELLSVQYNSADLLVTASKQK